MHIVLGSKVVDVDPDNELTEELTQPNVKFTFVSQDGKNTAALDENGNFYILDVTLSQDFYYGDRYTLSSVDNQPEPFTFIDLTDICLCVGQSGDIWKYNKVNNIVSFEKLYTGNYKQVLNRLSWFLVLNKDGKVLTRDSNNKLLPFEHENKFVSIDVAGDMLLAYDDNRKLWIYNRYNKSKIKSYTNLTSVKCNDEKGLIFALDNEGDICYYCYQREEFINIPQSRSYISIYVNEDCVLAMTADKEFYYLLNEDCDSHYVSSDFIKHIG